MIYVNQKFIDSCNSDCVLSQIKIRVSTTKAGTVLCTLNDDEFNISSNSIEKQASSGASCNIGGVCSNRLKIVLNQKGIDKLEGVDGFKKNYVLHLIQWNKVNDVNQSDEDYSLNRNGTENTTGKCDLGFYYISEIKNNYYDCEITAYDAMIAFRKTLTLAQIKYMQTTPKTIQQWLTYFCSLVNDSNFNIRCDGIYSNNANKNVNFTLSEDSSFDTIREAISQLAMLVMGYATINNYGNIIIRPAIKSTISVDESIGNKYMYNCDNEITESVVSYIYTSIAGFGYENTYTDQQDRNKINLYLEENKFLRGFEPYNGSALSSTTLTCLQNMANEVMGISFYSGECDINNRPYLELSDVVSVERRLVDQQGATSLINIPLVIDSLSHDVGVSTHITSNSTVSTNTDSMGKTNINSSIKEPSNNDIIDMITTPVTSYTTDGAFIKIRLDTDESKKFNQNEYADNIDVDDLDLTYTIGPANVQQYQGYILNSPNTIDAAIYSKARWEYLENKYCYSLRTDRVKAYATDMTTSLNIANMSNLIDKQFLYYANVYAGWRHNDPVLATLKGIYFFNGGHSGSKLQNVIRRSTIYDTTTASGIGLSNAIMDECFAPLAHTRIDTGLKFTDESVGTYGGREWFSYFRENKNGFNIRSDNFKDFFTVNAADDFDYKEIAKYMILLGDLLYDGAYGSIFGQSDRFIEVLIEYDFNGTHYSTYISLYQLLAQISFGGLCVVEENNVILSGLDSCSRQIDFITTNNIADNYIDLLKTIYESVVVNNYNIYLRAELDLEDVDFGDLESVDKDVVTVNDIEDLDNRVSSLENRVDNLNTTINAVNADLQDAKSDIAQNTQDIQANATNIQSNTQAISGLDTRVTALEQGGGGGSSNKEIVYSIRNYNTAGNTAPYPILTWQASKKKVYEEGSFESMFTFSGDAFQPIEDMVVEIELFLNLYYMSTSSFSYHSIIALYEANTATDIYNRKQRASSISAITPTLLHVPAIELKANKWYHFATYTNNNQGNISVQYAASSYTTSDDPSYYLHQLSSFLRIKKLNGTYYNYPVS